jgi:carbonic anhydrase
MRGRVQYYPCMSIEVRRAERDSDFRQLHRLFVEYEADLPPDLRHGAVPAVPDLKIAYAGKNAAFLASHEGDDIGCVAVAGLDLESTRVRHLFVKPQRRGLGAARWLIATAIRFAQESGYRRIVLDTSKARLKPAYDLYRSLGFQECEPYASVSYESPTFMALRIG